MGTVVHHESIRSRLRSSYTEAHVRELVAFLQASGTLRFEPLRTGLFPAVAGSAPTVTGTGYGNVWVRDNVHVAFAHLEGGQPAAAVAAVEGLAAFYRRHRARFAAVIAGDIDPAVVMQRPHIRFDGTTLAELDEPWRHDQNDALGAFLWIHCELARRRLARPDGELIALFALYFDAIAYWQDADSGHWEERPKVCASSIGAVVAGLRAAHALLAGGALGNCRHCDRVVTAGFVDALLRRGQRALAAILPRECVQPDPRRRRDHDAALLFLVHPFAVVSGPAAARIVTDVLEHLQGDFGIRRYNGDSYWTADYDVRWPAIEEATDPDRLLERRDALASPGEEAQWCLFDPVISVIAGTAWQRTGDPADLERQVRHLNRALGQLTGPDCPGGELRCPEAYYRARGRYVANDQVPLLWTQANVWQALVAMQRSAALID